MPRPVSGGSLSISQLEGILQQRKSEISRLQKERTVLERRLAKLDRRISALGGKARAGRAKNSMSLVAQLEDVLKKAGKPLSVGEILKKVHGAGYRSNSANFRGLLNQTLIKEKQFAQAGRGVYQLK